jgi:hypothetical protein
MDGDCPLLDAIWEALFLAAVAQMKDQLAREAKQPYKSKKVRASQIILREGRTKEDEKENDSADAESDEENERNGQPSEPSLSQEYVVVEHWWLWKPKKTPWTEILPGYLLHLGNAKELPGLGTILEKLTQSVVVVDSHTGQVGLENGIKWRELADPSRAFFESLSIEDRLRIMSFLITRSALASKAIRDYNDASLTELIDLRRQKREIENKKREL